MFLTAEDFVLPYNIPNVDRIFNTLEDYINLKEEEVLRQLLGDQVYEDFIDGLETSGPIEQKWLDLRDGGITFEYESTTYRYGGVKSILTPYVYSQWISDNASNYTGIGVTVANSENSVVVPPTNTIIKSYNDASRAGEVLYKFMASGDDYEGYYYKPLGKLNIFDL
jgi:hypothetical protein